MPYLHISRKRWGSLELETARFSFPGGSNCGLVTYSCLFSMFPIIQSNSKHDWHLFQGAQYLGVALVTA